VDFVNNVVVDGLARCVCSSLNFLLDQIDPECIKKAGLLPMLEIKMELVDVDVVFSPEIGFAATEPTAKASAKGTLTRVLCFPYRPCSTTMSRD